MQILCGVASCIMKLHKKGHVHCNIAPDGLLYIPEEDCWKFSSCISATPTNESILPAATELFAYPAPEVVAAHESDVIISAEPAVDAWSFGVIACSLLCTGAPQSLVPKWPSIDVRSGSFLAVDVACSQVVCE